MSDNELDYYSFFVLERSVQDAKSRDLDKQKIALILALRSMEGRRQTVNLTPTAIKAIESILSKGDRAEVIPTKEGPKVTRTVREVAYDPKKETRPG